MNCQQTTFANLSDLGRLTCYPGKFQEPGNRRHKVSAGLKTKNTSDIRQLYERFNGLRFLISVHDQPKTHRLGLPAPEVQDDAMVGICKDAQPEGHFLVGDKGFNLLGEQDCSLRTHLD